VSVALQRVAQAARAKARVLRTDAGWRKRFAHPNEQAFALEHFASDLESGLWRDWLTDAPAAQLPLPDKEQP
jgi:hypothetical protein